MDESLAWFRQSRADQESMEREYVAASALGSRIWCHVIAKCQQSVEKSVKAIVAALREAGLWRGPPIGFVQEVSRHMRSLIRLRHSQELPLLRRQVIKTFDSNTRSAIAALESLAPQAPPPGQPLRRNTEYPFHDAVGRFTFPASLTVFSRTELDQFRSLSRRLLEAAGRVIAMLRRGPK